jgi:hypothetical protein
MEALTDKIQFKLPDLMASNGKKNESQRPRPIHVSRSFSKLEPASPDRSNRPLRASTIQNGSIPDRSLTDRSSENAGKTMKGQPDAFDGAHDDGSEEGTGKLPVDFDELPIELVSLTDR